jgi:hypothetical protein
MIDLIKALGDNAAWILGFAVPGVIIACVAIISGCWLSFRKRKMEIELKHALVDRGMSADEIERVMKATMEPVEKDD